MAKENIKGTSFCGLGLESYEEVLIKSWIKEKDKSAKQLLRTLLRSFLLSEGLVKPHHK